MPTVSTNGVNLYYEELGAGPPLVCIMGITAPGSVWEAHAAYWQQHFRCIVADNRGVGHSDMPAGPYSTAMMADDYAGLLDALGVPRARVVGCSMGGAIALQLALRRPDLVESAVLMCPWARCDRYARGVFRHMTHIKARLTPDEFMNYIHLLIFSKRHWDSDEKHAELLESQRLAGLDPRPQPLFALQAQAAACTDHHVVDDLPRIKCPALVIGGAADIFTPPWMAEEVAAGIARSELHLYEGAGHAFHWERLDDFNVRVAAWLAAH